MPVNDKTRVPRRGLWIAAATALALAVFASAMPSCRRLPPGDASDLVEVQAADMAKEFAADGPAAALRYSGMAGSMVLKGRVERVITFKITGPPAAEGYAILFEAPHPRKGRGVKRYPGCFFEDPGPAVLDALASVKPGIRISLPASFRTVARPSVLFDCRFPQGAMAGAASASIGPAPPARRTVKVRADRLSIDFNRNILAAERRYSGPGLDLVIQGTVLEFGRYARPGAVPGTEHGYSAVFRQPERSGGMFLLTRAACFFPDPEQDEAGPYVEPDLSPGDRVSFKARYLQTMSGYSLFACWP
ncbi:MAG: hypothetical protein LBR80_15540 [Deltaproteobacteria bacterium]|jgi:hypothetical protein|nr:hypothetical protein [Deltaproteobacteria bacterium]